MSSHVISFGQLSVTITDRSDAYLLDFSGEINEHFNRSAIKLPDKKKVIINLEKVLGINSIGVREWIYFIRDISGPIELLDCSVSMIDQLNMVPESQGKSQIISFYAPYYCDCQGEVNVRLAIKDHEIPLKEKKAPNITCAICKKDMAFDSLEESYFLFMERQGV